MVLVALGALAVLAAGASAEVEVEPNNSTAEATPLSLNSTAYGNLTNASDRDFWLVSPGGLGGLLADLQCSPLGCPTVRVSDANNSTQPLYTIDFSSEDRFFHVRLYSGAPLWFELSMDHDGSWYQLDILYRSDMAWEEYWEIEPNDAPENATEVLDLPATLEGVVGADEGGDWWQIPIHGTGWAKIALTREEMDIVMGTPFEIQALADNETALGVSTGNASLMLVRVSDGVPLFLRVNSSAPFFRYSIRVVTRAAIEDFSRGPSETEPNNIEAEATLLSANATGEGILDGELDSVDHFRILAAAGSVVRITLNARDWWYVPRASLTIGGEPLPLVFAPEQEFLQVGMALFLVTDAGEPIILTLTAIMPEEHYSFQLNITHTGVLDDGTLSLEELDAVPEIGVWLAPKGVQLTAYSYDIKNGDGVLFGESVCARSNLTRQVAEVSVTSGRLLAPDDPRLGRFVVARDVLIPLYVDDPACFRAFAYDAGGYVGDSRDRYHTAGVVEGDAALVLAAIAATNRSDGAPYLALRAVLYNLTQQDAHDFGANIYQVQDARAFLDAAGVVAPLNNPPPAEAPPIAANPFRWDLPTALAVAAAAAILTTWRFWGRITNRPNDGAIRAMWSGPAKSPPPVPPAAEHPPPAFPPEPPRL